MNDIKKIKIINIVINLNKQTQKDVYEVKIKELDSQKLVTWILDGESLDNLVNQLTGKDLIFSKEQREVLCKYLVNKEFNYKVEGEMGEQDFKDLKNISFEDLQKKHDIIDKYPFYEAQEIANQEVADENKNIRNQ